MSVRLAVVNRTCALYIDLKSRIGRLSKSVASYVSSGSGGGRRGGHAPPPGPVKVSHKKDGHRRQPHRFHVSHPPPLYPAAGSATVCHV